MPTASPTASGLIALEATPVFPAVLAPNSEVMVQPDAAAVLTSSDRRVTVAVAAGVAHQPVRLSYTAASYTASQRQTAQRQGLLLTNLGFTLATAPATPLMAEITVRYSAAQISGIAEPSLTLFQRRTADGGWDPLPDCRVEPSERRVVCRAVANGDFLLAGTSGETLDTAVPPAPAPAAQWGGGAATLWGVLAAAGAVFLGGGAFLVWRARRVQP